MNFFSTFDIKVVQYCQYALGYLPMELLLDLRKLTYLSNISRLRKEIIFDILLVSDTEISDICKKYSFVNCSMSMNWKRLMHMHFCSKVNY